MKLITIPALIPYNSMKEEEKVQKRRGEDSERARET
uniref:Uncharacterized protein n=1 Tax=Nelumbo nucifera TaxID=4432 RepID=A0A822YVT9_NELNU|nr:TPA_asm: hypothetical protein HUJ06_006139 [Nelumbo nucifera]